MYPFDCVVHRARPPTDAGVPADALPQLNLSDSIELQRANWTATPEECPIAADA